MSQQLAKGSHALIFLLGSAKKNNINLNFLGWVFRRTSSPLHPKAWGSKMFPRHRGRRKTDFLAQTPTIFCADVHDPKGSRKTLRRKSLPLLEPSQKQTGGDRFASSTWGQSEDYVIVGFTGDGWGGSGLHFQSVCCATLLRWETQRGRPKGEAKEMSRYFPTNVRTKSDQKRPTLSDTFHAA